VDKNKSNSRRPEIGVLEAVGIYYPSIEDLIYEAANGMLSIYIKPFEWEIKLIASRKVPAPKTKEERIELIKKRHDYMTHIERYLDDLVNEISEETVSVSTFDGQFTIYPNNSLNRLNYIQPLMGFIPISDVTISDFRDGLEDTIFLKLNDLVGISENSSASFYFITLPFVSFIDALNDGKLYVMKADLHRVFPNESAAPAVAKPKAGATQETQDDAEITPASPMHTAEVKSQPSERSGIRERKKAEKQAEHQRWRTRAEQVHAEHPDWPQLRISKHIAPEFGVEFKTINNNIKIR